MGFGFGIWGLGFGAWGLGLGVWGSWFEVEEIVTEGALLAVLV